MIEVFTAVLTLISDLVQALRPGKSSEEVKAEADAATKRYNEAINGLDARLAANDEAARKILEGKPDA